jgi:hypothetical protein
MTSRVCGITTRRVAGRLGVELTVQPGDPVVDFLAVDDDVASGLEPEADLVTADLDDGESDLFVDDDLLVDLAR